MPKLKTNAAPTPAVVEQAAKIVSGYAVQVMAFIPVDKKDLRKQAEIPMLLLDVQEGEKTLADLAPHLKMTEVRQQFVGKRMTATEYAALFPSVAASADEEENKGSEETEPGNEGGEAE
jgi:hypothetical protein